MSTKLNPHSVVSIPTSLEDKENNFFKYWFEFLKPFHGLTNREIEVVAAFTRQRYNLSKVIKDSTLLDKVVMGEDIRRQVKEECGLSVPYFQVIMGKLRDNKLIVDNKLNPKYIPNVIEEDGNFKLLLLFNFK